MVTRQWVVSGVLLSALLCACGGGEVDGGDEGGDTQIAGDMPELTQDVRPANNVTNSPAPAQYASAPASPATSPATNASAPAPAASRPVVTPPAAAPSAPTSSVPPSTPATTVAPSGNTSSAPVANRKTGAKAVYDLLSQERMRCGFAPLQRNAKLDTAAENHALWILQNGVISHAETPGTVGFTGEIYYDRILDTGYNYSFSAEILNAQFLGASTVVPDWNTEGPRRIRSLMSAPFHMMGAFGGTPDIGIGIVVSADNPLADLNQARRGVALVVDLGAEYRKGGELTELSTDTIQTYPCQGTTGTVTRLSNETPNPVPGRNLAVNPVGQPVMVATGKKKALHLASYSIKDPSGQALTVLKIDHATDKVDLGLDIAFLIPDKPLLPNTRYTVSLNGTSGTTPFGYSFTFTTGN